MKATRQIFYKILKKAQLIAIGGSLVLLLLGKKTFALGFFQGAIIACVNFLILYISIIIALKKSYEKAFMIKGLSFIIRTFLYILLLYINLMKNYEIFAATLLGLHVIKFVILSNTICGRWKKWSSFQR